MPVQTSGGTTATSGGASPAAKGLDPLLVPFIKATTPREADRSLDKLIAEHAYPIIKGVVGRKWRLSAVGGRANQGQSELDIEDLQADALAQVIGRLNDARQEAGEPISDFRAYVAVTAYRACDMRLRQKYPSRWRLKSKIRYLLTHQVGFALWTGPQGDWLAGFQAWQKSGVDSGDADRLAELRTDPQRAVDKYGTPPVSASSNPADVAAAVFNTVGYPVDLDDLVNAMGEILNEKDLPMQTQTSGDEAAPDVFETVADSRSSVADEVGHRAYLQDLWNQIVELPPNQRAALLLNLRDAEGRGVIALFPLQGIATIRQLADTLSLSAETFAEIWHDLPLEDNAIAELLGLTRQQVISLRKVARERLARRMRHYEE